MSGFIGMKAELVLSHMRSFWNVCDASYNYAKKLVGDTPTKRNRDEEQPRTPEGKRAKMEDGGSGGSGSKSKRPCFPWHLHPDLKADFTWKWVNRVYRVGRLESENAQHAAVLAKLESFFSSGGRKSKRNRYKMVRAEVVCNTALRTLFEQTALKLHRRSQSEEFCEDWDRSDPEKLATWSRFEAWTSKGRSLWPDPAWTAAQKANIAFGWHGCSLDTSDKILRNGAADLRKRDGGYFGSGIYLAAQAEYACLYSTGDISEEPSEEDEFCVLLCCVALGNVYPVTRSADYKAGKTCSVFSEKPLKAGFSSHFVSIAADGHYQAVGVTSQAGPADYDEVVVAQEASVLPVYRVYFTR